MAVAKRMTKEELREDKVVTALKELGEIAQENAKTLVALAVILLAAIVGWIFFQNSRARAEENAALSLYQAQNLYFSGQYSQALTQLEALTSQYGSTQAGKVAPLFLGNARLATGNPAGAEDAYQNVVKSSDPLLEAAGHRGLAGAYADQQKFGEAADAYKKAAMVDGNPLADSDWMSAASCLMEAGRKDEAIQAFQTVIDDFSSSTRVQEAKVRIAEAKARG